MGLDIKIYLNNMKTAEEIKPNFAPVYVALYPKLAKIFQKHGYALAVHGSVARDFDLIAVAWAEKISNPEEVIKEITDTFAIMWEPHEPEIKNHNRKCYTLAVAFGECSIDLSFIN